MKTTQSTRPSGFTLIELLIVISIIAVLAAISIPTTAMVMNMTRKAQAGTQISNLVNAIKVYETDNGTLPVGAGGGAEEIETDQNFIDILTGHDTEFNPKEIVYFEGKQAKKASGNRPERGGMVNEGGGSQSLVDPWGNYYMVIMDPSDENEIVVPQIEDPVRANVVAWCWGKPEDKEDFKSARKNPHKDWIKSWK